MFRIEGPLRLSTKFQLRLPIELARRLEVHEGDEIYWVYDDAEPEQVTLLTMEALNRRYGIGAEIEGARARVADEHARASAAASAPVDNPASGR